MSILQCSKLASNLGYTCRNLQPFSKYYKALWPQTASGFGWKILHRSNPFILHNKTYLYRKFFFLVHINMFPQEILYKITNWMKHYYLRMKKNLYSRFHQEIPKISSKMTCMMIPVQILRDVLQVLVWLHKP